MKAIIDFVRKEFLQFKRDPKMFGLILIAPVIQLTFLGFAANLDVEKVRTIIFDQDRSVTSRNYIERFTSSGYFYIESYVDNYNDVTKEIDNGNALLALVIPNNFEGKINKRESAPVQIILDGSDGNSASIAAGYVQSITSTFSKNIMIDLMHRTGIQTSPAGNLLAEVRVWYNPTLKTRNFMVPGIVGLLLSIVTLILTSLAVVKEKEIGTLEQLVVTPLKPYQIIVGKLIPFTILGFAAVIIILTSMWVIFSIAVKGDILFLFVASFLYILSTLGLGLFVSTISKTQQQAMMIAIFGVMMPMIFLSGFAFPIENMPQVIQYISYIIPLRYFNDIIRGVILKGIGISELWIEAIALLFIGVTILSLSSLRFSRRLE
ncbi:MAG: ABC transporter permease [Ignavibacterium sp.]|nr:MAG: ABC transporter permease [Ignavibacterium sp.]